MMVTVATKDVGEVKDWNEDYIKRELGIDG